MQTNEGAIEQQRQRSHRSRAEWFEEAERWRATGQSAADYAREHGLNADTLSWWASRLKVRARPAGTKLAKKGQLTAGAPRFLPLRVVEQAPATAEARPEVARLTPAVKSVIEAPDAIETRPAVAPQAEARCEIEIVLLNGRRIRVGAGVDETVLERVLKVAEGGIRC
jgi:hypothetical protein